MLLAIQNRLLKHNILDGPKSLNIMFMLFLAEFVARNHLSADLEAIFNVYRHVRDLCPGGTSRV
jgi:hypothetical protein